MNDDAPAERKTLACGELPVALRLFGIERVLAEGIEREQTVIAGMPVSGVTRILGVIEHGNPNPLALQIACVVHPIGALAPDFRHRLAAVGVDHLAAPFFCESVVETDGEGAFLGV